MLYYYYYAIATRLYNKNRDQRVRGTHSTVVLWLIPIALGGRTTQKMHSCLILS